MKTRDDDFIFSSHDAGAEVQRDPSERPIFFCMGSKKTNHGGATLREKPGLARPSDPLHASSCSSSSPTSITGTGQRRAEALRGQSSVVLQCAGPHQTAHPSMQLTPPCFPCLFFYLQSFSPPPLFCLIFKASPIDVAPDRFARLTCCEL